jgi:hypothetical protein
MPSQSTTLVDEARVEPVLPAMAAGPKEVHLLSARLLAIAAWIIAPIVFWGGVIAAVLYMLQRIR